MDIKSIAAKIIILSSIPALIPLATWAAETPGADAPDLFSAGVKMGAAMLLIVSGLLLSLYFFKRLASSRSGLISGQDAIRILATRHLAPKNFITLVEIGDSVLTLGVTSENITALDKVPSATFHKNTEVKDAGPDRNSFAYRLKALTSQGLTSAKVSIKR